MENKMELTSIPVFQGVSINCGYSELLPPRDLLPHPDNPNRHPASQIALFKDILLGNGFRRPIVVSRRSGFITKGHGALEAALALGMTYVPVEHQDYASEELEIADIIADNRLATLSTMDMGKLQPLLVKLDGKSEIKLTAFAEKTLQTLFTSFGQAPDINYGGGGTPSPQGEPSDADESAPEPKENPAEHVRMVQIFLNSSNIVEFTELVEKLQARFGTDNTTDTILEVMRYVAAAG